MPIIYDISRVKDDPWFKEGKEEGIEEGVEIGVEKTIRNIVAGMLVDGNFSVERIAEIAKTTVEFVLKVKAGLNGK